MHAYVYFLLTHHLHMASSSISVLLVLSISITISIKTNKLSKMVQNGGVKPCKRRRKPSQKPKASLDIDSLYDVFDTDGWDKDLFAILQDYAPEDQKLYDQSEDEIATPQDATIGSIIRDSRLAYEHSSCRLSFMTENNTRRGIPVTTTLTSASLPSSTPPSPSPRRRVQECKLLEQESLSSHQHHHQQPTTPKRLTIAILDAEEGNADETDSKMEAETSNYFGPRTIDILTDTNNKVIPRRLGPGKRKHLVKALENQIRKRRKGTDSSGGSPNAESEPLDLNLSTLPKEKAKGRSTKGSPKNTRRSNLFAALVESKQAQELKAMQSEVFESPDEFVGLAEAGTIFIPPLSDQMQGDPSTQAEPETLGFEEGQLNESGDDGVHIPPVIFSPGDELQDDGYVYPSPQSSSSPYFSTPKTRRIGIATPASAVSTSPARNDTDRQNSAITPSQLNHTTLDGTPAIQSDECESDIGTLSDSVQVPLPNPLPSTPTKNRSAFGARKGACVRPVTKSPYFTINQADANSCLPFPPISSDSFGLIQERLAHDPFRLLVATIFLNKTKAEAAIPVVYKVFAKYRTIEDLANADPVELGEMIQSLGFRHRRSQLIIRLARSWIANPPVKGRRYRKLGYPNKLDGRDIKPQDFVDGDDSRVGWEVAHLPGIGAYAIDSWRIFCRDEIRGLATDWKGRGAQEGFAPEWKSVLPMDKELRAYLTWMWLKEGWEWNVETGVRTLATPKLMRSAAKGGVAHEKKKEGKWQLDTSPVKPTALLL